MACKEGKDREAEVDEEEDEAGGREREEGSGIWC